MCCISMAMTNCSTHSTGLRWQRCSLRPCSSHPWSKSNWYALMFFSSACLCVWLCCSETGRARASQSQRCHPHGRSVLGNQSLTCIWETCLVSSLALFPVPLSLSRSLNHPPPFPPEFLCRSPLRPSFLCHPLPVESSCSPSFQPSVRLDAHCSWKELRS